MYSFEGDYRRKPQQNLAGASRRDEKAVLLRHAQSERTKREQKRKRHDAALKIQAVTRGFLIRKLERARERNEFDEALRTTRRRNLNVDELVPYVRKLLFFYDRTTDASRLVWVLQHFLKLHRDIKTRSIKCIEWLWRLRWILRTCMRYRSDASADDSAYSLAIPLRALEVFTDREDAEKTLGRDGYSYLEKLFVYLINHGYFQRLRELIDEKVPPMMEATSTAPNPISKCLADMVIRPLDLIRFIERKQDFSTLVIQELCRSILHPKITDPIGMFIIPVLAEFEEFPYVRLIDCIDRLGIEPTVSLLYAVLALEPYRFLTHKSKEIVTSYLEVLASLGSTIVPLMERGGNGSIDGLDSISDHDDSDEDSDEDSNAGGLDRERFDVLRRAIDMLNEEQRVRGIPPERVRHTTWDAILRFYFISVNRFFSRYFCTTPSKLASANTGARQNTRMHS